MSKDFISDSEMMGLEKPAAAQKAEPRSGDFISDDEMEKLSTPQYKQPIGPEQAGAFDRFKERISDPERWKAIAFGTGPYAPEVVKGDVPLVIPAGAPIAAAGKFAEAMGSAGKIAPSALRAPEMLSKAAIALDAGKGVAYTAGRTALNAGQGAALSAMGGEEGESLGAKIDRAKSGGMLGGGIQLAAESLPVVGKFAGKIPGKINKWAEERAFKSAGAMLKDYRKAGKPERVEEIGRFMLDNRLVRPGMTVADVAEESQTLRNSIGQKIGDAYERAKAALQGADVPEANLDPKTLADEFMVEFAASQKGTPGASARIRSVQSLVDDLKELPPDGGFTAVNGFRQKLDDLLYAHDKTPGTLPETKQGMQEFRSWIDKRVDKAIDAIDSATGGQVSKELPALNRQYGVASEVAKISKDQAFRQNANRFFSPTDWASASTGAVIGAASGDSIENKIKNAAIGATLGAANKVRRKYGTPLVSQGLDTVGTVLKKPLNTVARATAPLAESGSGIAATAVRKITPGSAANEASAVQNVASNEQDPARKPAAPKGGPDRWALNGLDKLGITDARMADKLLMSKEGKRLLIEASDLKPGSPALQRIKDKIQKGYGGK